jgi:RNA polymerase sigma factor (TIGR02999 family)
MVENERSVTVLLHEWQRGDAAALEALGPILKTELRKLAAAHLRRERRGHTLSPTELVSEAVLRLMGDAVEWNDRVHFYAVAARHMRHVLVEHARKRRAEKRGGGERPITLRDTVVGAGERPAELVALDDALQALAREDERKARVVELSYFGGLGQAEIAMVLGVHVNTVARDLRLAEAWLRRELEGA